MTRYTRLVSARIEQLDDKMTMTTTCPYLRQTLIPGWTVEDCTCVKLDMSLNVNSNNNGFCSQAF